MSMNPFLRDTGERLLKLIAGISDRGGFYSDKAQMRRDDLENALNEENEALTEKAICGIYTLLTFADFATDEEFRLGEELKTLLPDDLQKRIDEARKDRPEEAGKVISLKTASQFSGNPMRYIWFPFIPCGEYSIMAAAGGSGKGMAACLIAAYISRGLPLPEDKPCPDTLRAFPWREPQNVLFISSEDTGDEIRNRLGVSHADLDRVYIADKDESLGLDFSTDSGLNVLKKMIQQAGGARFVVIDPVQAFIGGDTDMNRAAKMRTILSGISHVAGDTKSGILLIAHTSKKAQEIDLNGGILGSVETVNAARSVMHIMRDPEDENPFTTKRLILHTKVNNAQLARSIRFEIHEQERIVNGEKVIEAGGRFSEELYSDVTKSLFEESVRRRVTARELLALKRHEESEFDELTDIIREKADELRRTNKASAQFCYEEFDGYIWAGKRPADAIGRVAYKVIGDGIAIKAGILIKKTVDGRAKQSRGFKITLTR